MGDVVLTLPVLRGLLSAYPNLKITVVTRKNFTPFFSNIERLYVFAVDFKGRYKGFGGLILLYYDLLKSGKYNFIFDLHSVLRTHFLKLLFFLSGKKVFGLRKDRKQKKAALKDTGAPNFIHTTERYKNVFLKAGFDFDIMKGNVIESDGKTNTDLENYLGELKLKHDKFIGIAPFAKHGLKIYPEQKLRELLELLSKEPVEVFLFGGGKSEMDRMGQLADGKSNFHVASLNLPLELMLIKRLNLMLTMDSANMHIASLSGIPVISVWGATHPGMGFGALNQPEQNYIQIPVTELNCRPCTVFGKGICRRGDFACMNNIAPGQIFLRIQAVIGNTLG